MGKKTPEDNSKEAADKTGAYGFATAQQEAFANRPNQINPFGQITYDRWLSGWSPSGQPIYQWLQNQTLNPEYQGLLDNQTEIARQEQGLRSGLLGDLGGGVDTEQFGQVDMDQYGMGDLDQFGPAPTLDFDPTAIRNQAQDAAWNYATNRLDPRFEQESQQMEIKLRNQGLRPGDQAYDAQMSNLSNSRNDAYEQAMWGSYGEGRQEADSLFGQQLESAGFLGDQRQNNISNYLQNLESSYGRDVGAREQAIKNYLAGRGQSLEELTATDPSATLGNAVNIFGGGSGGGTE